jgi:hypothetical protein
MYTILDDTNTCKATKKNKNNENTVRTTRSQRIIEKNNQVIAQRERCGARGARVVPVVPSRHGARGSAHRQFR